MVVKVKAPLADRAKEANYTPPKFKFNPDLEGKRDLIPLLLDPEKTALLIIDVQNLFTSITLSRNKRMNI